MLLSAVSVLVVAQSSSEIPEGLMNNPVYVFTAQGHYLISKLATPILREGMNGSARRYSFLPWLGVHVC